MTIFIALKHQRNRDGYPKLQNFHFSYDYLNFFKNNHF